MRILEVTQRYPPAIGGVEAHVQHVAHGLAGRGFDVAVATTDLARDRPFARLPATRETEPFPVHRARAYRFMEARHGLGIVAPGMFGEIARSRADVVHAHAFGYPPTWMAALLRRVGRRPLVVTPHSDEGTRTGLSELWARSIARATLRPADRVIALTELSARHLGSLGVDPAKIRVIPNGIDLAEFAGPRAPEAADPVVLFVGRLYPEQKGLRPLVEALAQLPGDVRWTLRVVGEDWGGAAVVREVGARHGLSERIQLVGAVPRAELLEEYRRATVFVCPSLFEPFGIVLLEAMAAGVPIIASRTGGIPEVLEDGRDGFLAPPGDVPALAQALTTLLRDADRRQELVKRGRERVQAYDWERLYPTIEAVFREVAA